MIKLNSEGLLPVITQDAATHKVLTLAYMSKESLQKTYNWLIENKAKGLNYFHLRGENLILKNIPVSLYKKFVWKLFDYINSLISNIKKILRSVKFIINPYRKIKNIIVQRTR